jgi:hypothetical protein
VSPGEMFDEKNGVKKENLVRLSLEHEDFNIGV